MRIAYTVTMLGERTMNKITVLVKIIKYYIWNLTSPCLRGAKGCATPIKIWRFGELNQEKIIYFITDVSSKRSGTFSIYLGILKELSFAKMMNWVPIIDETPNLLRKMKTKGMKGKNNVKEIFRFSNSMPLREVMNSHKVVISSMTDKHSVIKLSNMLNSIYKVTDGNLLDLKDEQLEYWREFAHTHLCFQEQLKKELDNAYQEVIQGKTDVLSVAVREGKMALNEKTRITSGERVQPSVQEIVEITKKYFSEWNCKYIYLSCEAPETIEMFKKAFPEDVILVLERSRTPMENLGKIKDFKSSDKHYKDISKIKNFDTDYIKDMYILSKGDYLICPINCGTEAAYIMSNGFKNCHIIIKD